MNDANPAPPGKHLEPSASAVAPAAIVLTRGHYGGSAAADELSALVARLRTQLPDWQIVGAFVDRAAPSLNDALDTCANAPRIIVLPVFVPADPALERWLRKVAMRWRHARPADAPQSVIHFAPALGSLPDAAHAATAALREHAAGEDVAATVGARWAHDPVAWSEVPAHRRHLLLCTGPRCTALGAGTLWLHLDQRLREHHLLRSEDGVMALQTGCQYPCNLGPLLIVYPEGVWYGRLDATALDRVVSDHLLGGHVVASCVVHGPMTPPPPARYSAENNCATACGLDGK